MSRYSNNNNNNTHYNNLAPYTSRPRNDQPIHSVGHGQYYDDRRYSGRPSSYHNDQRYSHQYDNTRYDDRYNYDNNYYYNNDYSRFNDYNNTPHRYSRYDDVPHQHQQHYRDHEYEQAYDRTSSHHQQQQQQPQQQQPSHTTPYRPTTAPQDIRSNYNTQVSTPATAKHQQQPTSTSIHVHATTTKHSLPRNDNTTLHTTTNKQSQQQSNIIKTSTVTPTQPVHKKRKSSYIDMNKPIHTTSTFKQNLPTNVKPQCYNNMTDYDKNIYDIKQNINITIAKQQYIEYKQHVYEHDIQVINDSDFTYYEQQANNLQQLFNIPFDTFLNTKIDISQYKVQ